MSVLCNQPVQCSAFSEQMTHAIFGTFDQTLSNGEVAYSHENTLRLALQDSNLARHNADNYALYALACYLSRTDWSTDPNNIQYGGLQHDELISSPRA